MAQSVSGPLEATWTRHLLPVRTTCSSEPSGGSSSPLTKSQSAREKPCQVLQRLHLNPQMGINPGSGVRWQAVQILVCNIQPAHKTNLPVNHQYFPVVPVVDLA